jgi:hypothetical protein
MDVTSDIVGNMARLTWAVLVNAVAVGLGPQIARVVRTELDRQKAAAE